MPPLRPPSPSRLHSNRPRSYFAPSTRRRSPLQDHQRDLAACPALIVVVGGVGLDDARPQPRALLRVRHARVHRAALRAHLHGGIRIRPQVVEPRRVLGIAALRGHDHEVVAVGDVEQGAGALDAALRPNVVEQEHGCDAGDVVSDDSVRRAVDERVHAHQPPEHGPAPVREVEIARPGHGVRTSLPVVPRARMSSWARRASSSGYVSPTITSSSPARTASNMSSSASPSRSGYRIRCMSQKPITPRLVAMSLPGFTLGAPSRPAWPKCTSRPKWASALRLCSNVEPPTISRITSTWLPSLASMSAAVRSSARESKVASAPSRVTSSRFGALDAPPITLPAPKRFASWTAIVPTPPAAAWTATLSPSRSCALVRSRCQALVPWTTRPNACASLTPSGTFHISDGWASARSAYPPPFNSATTRSPSGVVPTTSPPGTSGSSAAARYEFSA